MSQSKATSKVRSKWDDVDSTGEAPSEADNAVLKKSCLEIFLRVISDFEKEQVTVEKDKVAAVKRNVAVIDLLHTRTPAQHLLRHNEIKAAEKLGRKGIPESVMTLKDKDGRIVDDRKVDHLGLYYFAEGDALELSNKASTTWSKYLQSSKGSKQKNGVSPAAAGATSKGKGKSSEKASDSKGKGKGKGGKSEPPNKGKGKDKSSAKGKGKGKEKAGEKGKGKGASNGGKKGKGRGK